MNNAKLQLEVVSPTTIKCGHIEWFALDAKLVGKVKALLEENQKLKDKIKKLNYKIKELDDMFYETFRISRDGYFSISKWELKNFTNKVQELMLVGEDNGTMD